MGDVSTEPSMEDILSSIKRIIAEEGDSATAARTKRAPRAAPAGTEASGFDTSREVLELSEPIAAEPAAPLAPAPAPVAAPAAMAEPILSPKTAEVSRGALDTLSRMVVRSDDPVAENTLEGLVRELIRPMLRDWLDAKLPGIVEAMVAREIARITNQR